MLKKTNKSITDREAIRDVDLKHFRYVLEAMQDVQNQVAYTASYKKVVEHAYDAISGSPMRSTKEVYGVEQEIVNLIVALKQEVLADNEDAVKKVCLDIEKKVAERNRIIQLSR